MDGGHGLMDISRAHLEAELAHCRSQRDQEILALAQVQQMLTNATGNINRCNGAEQQLLNLIAKLDEPPPEPQA